VPDPASLVADLSSLDERRAEAAVSALAELGEPALVATLPLLQSTSAENRWWAVRVAAAIQSPQSSQALAAALDDAEPLVRHGAAVGLRLQPSPQPLRRWSPPRRQRPLMARLASDAPPHWAPPALRTCAAQFRSSDVATRIYATRALALMDEPGVTTYCSTPSTTLHPWSALAERGLERRGVGMVFFAP
jgi:hypothetical protein